MLRQHRLRRRVDFAHVQKHGKRWQHPFLTISIVPNELHYNRYGYVTSRRLGGAVVRNRVRRVLRELVRQMHPQLGAGFDVVLVARNAIVGQPYRKQGAVLESLFRRANLWREREP